MTQRLACASGNRSGVWVAVALVCGACGTSGRGNRSDGGGDSVDMAGAAATTDDGGMQGFNRDAACAQVSAAATLEKKPVDIIITIDNSGSMTDKIVATQNNLNGSFAQIIGASGLDYRVILLSKFGNAFPDPGCYPNC